MIRDGSDEAPATTSADCALPGNGVANSCVIFPVQTDKGGGALTAAVGSCPDGLPPPGLAPPEGLEPHAARVRG